MARYRPVDTQPTFVAIDLAAQLLPGTFEHALHHLLEQAVDLTPFDLRERVRRLSAQAAAHLGVPALCRLCPVIS
jgi:hypothetical protein